MSTQRGFIVGSFLTFNGKTFEFPANLPMSWEFLFVSSLAELPFLVN